MENNKKFRLEQQTKRRYFFLRLQMGCKALLQDRRKQIILVVYLAFAAFLWCLRVPLFGLHGDGPLGPAARIGMENILRLAFVAGLFGVVMLVGVPFGSRAIHDNLRRAGFTNSAGETPLLIAAGNDETNPHVTVYEFDTCGVPLTEWENRRDKLESALDAHIVTIKEGSGKRRVLLHCVPSGNGLPDVLHWSDDLLDKHSFVLVLGMALTGRVVVNLAKIPHILLGGSTGSGKSVLLKLLLMQCVRKGAYVYIADFKGGVDFPRVWHNRCHMVTDKEMLLRMLSGVVDELESRKMKFADMECANLDEYNRKINGMHTRIVFACDEVAELLDKTGLNKAGKDLVAQIEGKLAQIARQGRAFGIHLILATQRPDANILAGQIRNNIDIRVCGRADNVLSQIILDSTDAADRIPKDAQGRFLMHDGTVFQAFLFDEQTAFDKGGGSA